VSTGYHDNDAAASAAAKERGPIRPGVCVCVCVVVVVVGGGVPVVLVASDNIDDDAPVV